MDQQLDILGGAKPVGRQAPRQDVVLRLLQSNPDGITVDEAGAAIHAAIDKHAADEICRWCAVDGKDVLRALERKHLVRRTGVGMWLLTEFAEATTGGPGELPEGF